MESNAKYIDEACNAISNNRLDLAKKTLEKHYPFVSLTNTGRQYSEYQKTRVFFRDGFVDRYSGDKLVFPPVLRLLSRLMPEEFPFHPNWKMNECYIAYWQLLPTIDHFVPVSRGGIDEEANWVCTSQLRNSAKSIWLLDELGWQLQDPGRIEAWDGLVSWFMRYTSANPGILDDKYIAAWHKAAGRVIE